MPYFDTKLSPDDLAVGSSLCLQMDEAQVGIFRTTEGLFALDNICPHRGAPLHDGVVTDGFVTCPWHQWQFQLGDGVCRNIPGVRVAPYSVEIRDGTIWINLEGKPQS